MHETTRYLLSKLTPSFMIQIEIKQFLERVYGLKVAAIQTVNYEGKKKRRKTGYFLRPGYKKVRQTSKACICLAEYFSAQDMRYIWG